MFNPFMSIPIAATLLVLSGATSPKMPQPRPGGMPKHSEEKKVAEIGEEAPMFELKDQHGKTHKLSDYKGKIVVLEWFNERCPYCKGVWASGLISKTLTDLGKLDSEVVYLTMNSTANRPEEDVLESGAEFIEEMEVEVPMLMDYNGKVGRAYGARTTPHMFVIDAEGVLVYQGAISDDQRNKEGEKAETHVMRAINQLNTGEEVSPSYVQPWGCSVKYARGGKQDHPKRPRRPRSPASP